MQRVAVNAIRHVAAPRVAGLSFRGDPRNLPLRPGFPQETHGTAQPPLVLVLDVDETLWRSHVPGLHKTQRRFAHDFVVEIKTAGVIGTSITSEDDLPPPSFITPDTGKLETHEIHVSLRPGLAKFFEWILSRRSEGVIEGPWIFTQGSTNYLNALLPRIDPTAEIFGDRVLTRSSCHRFQNPWPWVHKDLSQVPCGEDKGSHPERVILVENNAMSGLLNPDHLLMVHDWIGMNKFDRELSRVSATLDEVILQQRTHENSPPGSYAERLREITPAHDEFREELERLHRCVTNAPLAGQTDDQAVSEVWKQAVRAKTKLIGQQSAFLKTRPVREGR